MGKIQKAVLSRLIVTECLKSPIVLFNTLSRAYSHSFNYLFHIAGIGTWLGATPELLAAFFNNCVSTVALAGTKSINHKIDWTQKEFHEQKVVTDYVVQILDECGCEEILCEGPVTVTAGPVEHLKTSISARLNERSVWKNVVQNLHPTPATCGLPLRESQKFIKFNEGHDRRFYTGFIGLIGATEQTFYVNLRCMEIFKNEACLYVGGGITKQSQAEHEWNETQRKAETLLHVLL